MDKKLYTLISSILVCVAGVVDAIITYCGAVGLVTPTIATTVVSAVTIGVGAVNEIICLFVKDSKAIEGKK